MDKLQLQSLARLEALVAIFGETRRNSTMVCSISRDFDAVYCILLMQCFLFIFFFISSYLYANHKFTTTAKIVHNHTVSSYCWYSWQFVLSANEVCIQKLPEAVHNFESEMFPSCGLT